MIAVAVVALAAVTSSAHGAEVQLQVVPNERLAYILTNLQILRETSREKSKALRVRVIVVPEHGECGDTPQSCPKVEGFIAVSGFDEYPDQRVYELPKRHDWRFVRWDRLPDADGPTDYVELTLEADEPVPQPAATWWRKVRYRFKVNYRDGTMLVQGAG